MADPSLSPLAKSSKDLEFAVRMKDGTVHSDPAARAHVDVFVNSNLNPDDLLDSGFTVNGKYYPGAPKFGPKGVVLSIDPLTPPPDWAKDGAGTWSADVQAEKTRKASQPPSDYAKGVNAPGIGPRRSVPSLGKVTAPPKIRPMTRDGSGEAPNMPFVPLSRKAKPPSNQLPRYLVEGVKVQGEEARRFPLRVGPVTVSPPEGGGIRSLKTQAKIPVLKDIEVVKEEGLLNRLLTMKEVVDREAKTKASKKLERAFLKGLTPQEKIEYERKKSSGWEDTDGMTYGGSIPHPFTKGADDPLPYRRGKLSLEERKYAPIEKSIDEVLGEYRDKKTRLIGQLPQEDLQRLARRSKELLNVEVPPLAKFSQRDWALLRESGIPSDQLFWKTNNFKAVLPESLVRKVNAYRFAEKGEGKGALAEEFRNAMRDPRRALSVRDDLVSRYEATLRALRGSDPETAEAVLGGMEDLGKLWHSTAYGKLKGNKDWVMNLKEPPPPAVATRVWRSLQMAEGALGAGDHVGASTALLAAYSHREGNPESGEVFERMAKAWRGAVNGTPIPSRDPALPRTDLFNIITRKGVPSLGAPENPPKVRPGTPEWVETFNPRLVERLDEQGKELASTEAPNFAAEKALGRTKPLRPSEVSTVEEMADRLSDRNHMPQPVDWIELPKMAVSPGRGRTNFHGELEEEPLPAPTFESVRVQKAKDALLDARKQVKGTYAPYWRDRKRVAAEEAESFGNAAMEYADEMPPEVQASLDRMMRQAYAPLTRREVRWLNKPVTDAAANVAAAEAMRPSEAWYKIRGAFSAVRNEYKQAGYAILNNLNTDLTKAKPPIRAVIIQAGEWAKEGIEEEEILKRFGGEKFKEHRKVLKALFDDATPPPVGGLPEVPVKYEPIRLPEGKYRFGPDYAKAAERLEAGRGAPQINAPVSWSEGEAAKALEMGRRPAPALAEAAQWLEREMAPKAGKAVGKATSLLRAILRGV